MSHKRKEAPSGGGDLAAAVEAARHAASARYATIWRESESGPQQAAEIKVDLDERLRGLHAVADGVYARWIEHLRR